MKMRSEEDFLWVFLPGFISTGHCFISHNFSPRAKKKIQRLMRLRVLLGVQGSHLLNPTIHTSVRDRKGSCEQSHPDPHLIPLCSSDNPNMTNISQSEETQKIPAKVIIWMFKISTQSV